MTVIIAIKIRTMQFCSFEIENEHTCDLRTYFKSIFTQAEIIIISVMMRSALHFCYVTAVSFLYLLNKTSQYCQGFLSFLLLLCIFFSSYFQRRMFIQQIEWKEKYRICAVGRNYDICLCFSKMNIFIDFCGVLHIRNGRTE